MLVADTSRKPESYDMEPFKGHPGVYILSPAGQNDEEPHIIFYKRLHEIFDRYSFSREEAEARQEIYEELRYVDFFHPETRFGIYEITEGEGRFSIDSLMPRLSNDIRTLRRKKMRKMMLEKVEIGIGVLKDFDRKMHPDVGVYNWGIDGKEPYFLDMEVILNSDYMRKESIDNIVREQLGFERVQ